MIKYNITKLNNLVNNNYNSSSVVQPTNKFHIFKGDSGATNHYVAPSSKSTLKNVVQNNEINVTLPDNSNIQSTHTGNINIPKLSNTATTAHILPALKDTSLISLGQLADDGCQILLDKATLHVFKNFELILQGFRNRKDGLWDIPIPSIPTNKSSTLQKINFITNKNQPTKTLIQYLHATLFSPTKTTLLKAVRNNHLIGWPGLTITNITKYLDETPATAKGHLDQHKQNLQSTKLQPSTDEHNLLPTTEKIRTHQALATIIDNTNKKAYFDLTGPFPYISKEGINISSYFTIMIATLS